METVVIRPTTFVAEVAAIEMRLAAAIENGSEVEAMLAARAAHAALLEWMEMHEANARVATITEERRRCVKCERAASYTRCSGPVCLMCAKAIRNERLNKEWGEA